MLIHDLVSTSKEANLNARGRRNGVELWGWVRNGPFEDQKVPETLGARLRSLRLSSWASKQGVGVREAFPLCFGVYVRTFDFSTFTKIYIMFSCVRDSAKVNISEVFESMKQPCQGPVYLRE